MADKPKTHTDNDDKQFKVNWKKAVQACNASGPSQVDMVRFFDDPNPHMKASYENCYLRKLDEFRNKDRQR